VGAGDLKGAPYTVTPEMKIKAEIVTDFIMRVPQEVRQCHRAQEQCFFLYGTNSAEVGALRQDVVW
jgi:hypothetical protein